MEEESVVDSAALLFSQRKIACLCKKDKSSAGQIDVHCLNVCNEINKRDEFYTTSSCSGRCFIYCGMANKSNGGKETFERYRVHHEHVLQDPKRYFNMTTLPSNNKEQNSEHWDLTGGGDETSIITTQEQNRSDTVWWLRFEPFILHVCCRTLEDAHNLVQTSRPVFKNVGLTSWKQDDEKDNDNNNQQKCSAKNINVNKYIVAIWGDEGLDMPLTSPRDGSFLYPGSEEWLASLVHARHLRNYEKIQKFTTAVQTMSQCPSYSLNNMDHAPSTYQAITNQSSRRRSYEVIGDVALLHGTGKDDDTLITNDNYMQEIASSILASNKAIKIVALRTASLSTENRSVQDGGIRILAGPQRDPLMTTHVENGISCPIHLTQVFFSTRMAKERSRICQQVNEDERVLCLFSGVGMEALQIAAIGGAKQVFAIEKNPFAAECARRGLQILSRNKKFPRAADRVHLFEGDVMKYLSPSQTNNSPLLDNASKTTEAIQVPLVLFDRILAPRPKEGIDGDALIHNNNNDINGKGGGESFLEILLPLLRTDGGKCHWYDFCADHEMPECVRTRTTVQKVCDRLGYEVRIVEIVNAGSVAKRQYRVCVDFILVGSQSKTVVK